MATAQNRSTQPTTYLCLKSRWLLAVFNDWTLLTGLILVILLVRSKDVVKLQSKTTTSPFNTSLHLSLSSDVHELQLTSLENLHVAVTYDISTQIGYLNSTLNHTITTAYSSVHSIDLQSILASLIKSVNQTIVSSLASQNDQLQSLKSTLETQAVYVDSSVNLDSMNINYTWIGDYLNTSASRYSIPNPYSSYYNKLSSYFDFLDNLCQAATKNISSAFGTVETSDISLYNYTSPDNQTTKIGLSFTPETSPTHVAKSVYVLPVIMVLFIFIQLVLNWLHFVHEQKQAASFPLEATEKTDFLHYTFQTVDFEAFKLWELFTLLTGDFGAVKYHYFSSFWLGIRSNAKNLGKYVFFAVLVWIFWVNESPMSGPMTLSLSGDSYSLQETKSFQVDAGIDTDGLLDDLETVFDNTEAEIDQFLTDNGLDTVVGPWVINRTVLDNYGWPSGVPSKLGIALDSAVSNGRTSLDAVSDGSSARVLLVYAFVLAVGAVCTAIGSSVWILWEIDRVFKKIGEGLEIFDTLYYRHENATNGSQKEKLENDLKKEIKKLQRFREQVKNWQATNEVKDKEKLNENRRLVEQAMEKYKLVEKGSKTKAYSDQSLASYDDIQEDNEATEFVKESLDDIMMQEEILEAELDKLAAKKGKRTNTVDERKTEIEDLLEIHQWHKEKLEVVLRLLESRVLRPEDVMNIQEDIKYYLEENQDPDFVNDETIYDDLNLDVDENALLEGGSAANGVHKEEESVLTSTAPISVSVPEPVTTPVKKKETTPTPNVASVQPIPVAGVKAGVSVAPAVPKTATPTATLANLAGSLPTMSTLKPAPVPAKPVGELKWAAAVSQTANGKPKPNGAEEKSPATTPLSTMNTNALNAASVLEALKKQRPQDGVSRSASESRAGSTASGLQSTEVDADPNFRFLPPGIQSTILSFVEARNRPESDKLPSLSGVSTMLAVPRRFSPLAEGTYPPGLEAQRVSAIWNSVRVSPNLEIDSQNVDSATLFYAYYYGLSQKERDVASAVLTTRLWRVNNDKSMWFQRHSQVKVSGDGFEISDFNIFDAEKWSFYEKKNYKVDYSQFGKFFNRGPISVNFTAFLRLPDSSAAPLAFTATSSFTSTTASSSTSESDVNPACAYGSSIMSATSSTRERSGSFLFVF
ncbi:hypothetical protein OGAPHI_006002 [Ogataea philodendri]|uniref:Uncharacterized protein n=1 Tax=Ogataea philodendri TaxID=1378263 RepID=A0A9P8NYJ6_9ASCO|nr:uncharacterized protein OGAPHI_006002 [Ogataea philodendri]KAH3661824.1 hypothetical protein OGAPHI_006002 [Ogataea philodendri]